MNNTPHSADDENMSKIEEARSEDFAEKENNTLPETVEKKVVNYSAGVHLNSNLQHGFTDINAADSDNNESHTDYYPPRIEHSDSDEQWSSLSAESCTSEQEDTEGIVNYSENSLQDSHALLENSRNARPRVQRKSHRKSPLVLFAVVALLLSVLGFSAYKLLTPDNNKEFSGPAGKEKIVELHGTTISEFAEILEDQGIVSHAKLFVKTVNNRPMQAGYYVLPEHISSNQAAETILSGSSLVGRIIIPPGYTLLSHMNNAHKKLPGIFSLIAKASCITLDGHSQCFTTEEELEKTAREASAQELGIPHWARNSFARLKKDPRRIEGLIAAGTWDLINPQDSALHKLHDLITLSTQNYVQYGINSTNITPHFLNDPYKILTIASLVEREAGNENDYKKISRVIFNRLTMDPPMKLDMDSTVNYYFGKSALDFNQQKLNNDNPWNTRVRVGLPITPIGTASEPAIAAAIHPAMGNWKYFITVDSKGTTLFASTYEEHMKNIQVACRNKFLSSQCK